MQEAIDVLLPELTKAREEYEYYDKRFQDVGDDYAWRRRCETWGRWNGLAKAIEILKTT